MKRRASPLVVGAALLAWSCGAPLMKLPAGPGAPADATEALAAATLSCRGLSSLLRRDSRPRLDRRRTRARPAAGRRGRAGFRFASRRSRRSARPSSSWSRAAATPRSLPRDGRVLEHGAPGAGLEAVTGVPVDAADLLPLLTGCRRRRRAAARARAIGDWLARARRTADVYLRRDAGAGTWRLVAAVHRRRARAGAPSTATSHGTGPHTIRLREPGTPRRFDLRLTLAQVTLDDALGPEVFEVRMPAGRRRSRSTSCATAYGAGRAGGSGGAAGSGGSGGADHHAAGAREDQSVAARGRASVPTGTTSSGPSSSRSRCTTRCASRGSAAPSA